MGPYSAKSYTEREDLRHYRQPIQERSRGHGKSGNVPFNQPVQRREGTTKTEKTSKKMQTEKEDCSELYSNSRKSKTWLQCGECGTLCVCRVWAWPVYVRDLRQRLSGIAYRGEGAQFAK